MDGKDVLAQKKLSIQSSTTASGKPASQCVFLHGAQKKGLLLDKLGSGLLNPHVGWEGPN